MIMGYKFFMQHFPKDGVVQPIKDLEVDFNGLKYKSLVGIDDYGKIKNLYVETFVESSQSNVFIPSVITRENTTIELELWFLGSLRRTTYHSFVEYVTGSKFHYWDNARNRKVGLVLKEACKPDEEKLKGSSPYLKATFKFSNLDGSSTNV